MKLIDIDRIHYLESHVFYIKEFDSSVVVMDNRMQIHRYDMRFAIEYKPLGDTVITFKQISPELEPIKEKLLNKIKIMDQDGKFMNE